MKHQKTIEQNIINFIKKHELISDVKRVLVGLSGGADSVFALHFLLKYAKKYNINISALHVNHNLRGKESDNDEVFCKKKCKKLNVEFFSTRIDVKTFAKKNKYSSEEAARILRYKEFEKYLELSKSDLIVTAHNNDDNTETVLLNIVNGSGINGVSGIPPKRNKIIRPLLCVSKKEIIEYLNFNQIKYVEDSSNRSLDFDRNYIRHKIIPGLKKNINPSIDRVILNSSEVFRNQNKVIEYFIDILLLKFVEKKSETIILNCSELDSFPKEILGELFKRILEKYLDVEYNFVQYEKLLALIVSQVGTLQDFGKNTIGVKERNKILFNKKQSAEDIEIKIEIGRKYKLRKANLTIEEVNDFPAKFKKTGKIEYISGENISSELLVRNWKKGDKIKLLGMNGTKKISDVLTDLKIDTSSRNEMLVLINNKEVVWLIGKRISENYKITSETKRILKLCLD